VNETGGIYARGQHQSGYGRAKVRRDPPGGRRLARGGRWERDPEGVGLMLIAMPRKMPAAINGLSATAGCEASQRLVSPPTTV